MIPQRLRPLFWDTDATTFDPAAYPVYTVERVLEYGDEEDVTWLLRVCSIEKIREVLRTDRHISPRSANFWSLFFAVPQEEVASLNGENRLNVPL
jgi:uncharacterized protein DUF6922